MASASSSPPRLVHNYVTTRCSGGKGVGLIQARQLIHLGRLDLNARLAEDRIIDQKEKKSDIEFRFHSNDFITHQDTTPPLFHLTNDNNLRGWLVGGTRKTNQAKRPIYIGAQ